MWWPEDADHIAFIRGRIGFELPAWFIPKDEKQVPTLVLADDVTAQLLLHTPRSGICAPPRLSGSYLQTPLCWGVASTCSRWAEKAVLASYFQLPLM
ncbi:hypothetical protein ACT453_13655 [Bacillus sp. D-CC]